MEIRPGRNYLTNTNVIKIVLGKSAQLEMGIESNYASPEDVLPAVSHALSANIWGWQLTYDKNTAKLDGIGKVDDMPIFISMTYPRNTGIFKELRDVFDSEDGIIPLAILLPLLVANRQMISYNDGNIPEMFIGFPARMSADLTIGMDKYFFDRGEKFAYDKNRRLMSKKEIAQTIQDIDPDYFDGTKPIPLHPIIKSDKHKVLTLSKPEEDGSPSDGLYTDEMFLLLFPNMKDCHPLDFVNLMMAFGKYLWSTEWWESKLCYAFARGANSVLASFLETFSIMETFSRKPTHNYKGYEFSFGAPISSIFGNTFSQREESAVITTSIRSWLQIIEFYSTNTPVEVVKAMIPNGVYVSELLNVDFSFENTSRNRKLISQIKVLSDIISEKTEQNKKYVPVGHFFLNVPEEFIRLVNETELKKLPIEHEFDVDIERFHIYCDDTATGFWARIFGKKGEGVILRWYYNQPIQDNLISIHFARLLDAIFSSIWHDLCCQGETTFKVRSPRKSTSTTGTNKPQTRSTGDTVRVLPRTQVIYLNGTRDWGDAEEREHIRRNAHSVSGHVRNLPEGWKRNPQAEEDALGYGLILLPNQTLVHPHTRGLIEGDVVPDAPVRVVSRGLASVMTFFTKLNEGSDDDEDNSGELIVNY